MAPRLLAAGLVLAGALAASACGLLSAPGSTAEAATPSGRRGAMRAPSSWRGIPARPGRMSWPTIWTALPAAARHLTRRRVRVVETGEAYAAVFFRLLAAGQHLRMLAERSERYEMTRAAAVLPRLVWDAAGLVPLAADDVEARELLLGYEQSLALLVDEATEVERQEEAVESAIRADRAPAPPARPALPEGLLPRALLDEARLELKELGQGLRHAREVLGGADDGVQHARSGESDE